MFVEKSVCELNFCFRSQRRSSRRNPRLERGKRESLIQLEMEHHPSGSPRNVVPRYLLVREFLNARVSETKLLCHSLKRKLGEDLFGSSAVDGKSRRRATSPRSWKFWQRDERKRKRKGGNEDENEEERLPREKRRKETRKESWRKERGKLATHEWLAKRCAHFSLLLSILRLDFIFRSLSLALRSMPMKNKHAPSQSEMNTMATRDLVT